MTLKWSFLLFGLIVVAEAQNGYQRENPADQLSYSSGIQGPYGDEEASSGDEIPGEPDKDYPVFREVPETRFDCAQQQFPGYYADTEARCQAYHICQIGGRKDSFLCPNGTVFNQEKVVCDWWFNFDCAQAQSFYSINEAIVRAMAEADRITAERKAAEGYRYNAPEASRNHQQRPSASTSAPKSDFDTIVVEAARGAPPSDLSQGPQSQHGGYETPEMTRHQPAGPYHGHDDMETSQLTGATFGKQIGTNGRDAEAAQDPARQYLPAQLQRANKY